jgi:hypothetical protein
MLDCPVAHGHCGKAGERARDVERILEPKRPTAQRTIRGRE